MPTKLYPMPRINFSEALYATCNPFSFEYNGYDETIHIHPISKQIITGEINYIQFEQAVQEWISNWIKENFEPIVVPDLDIKYDDNYKDGFNECIANLLELNPNCIRSEG